MRAPHHPRWMLFAAVAFSLIGCFERNDPTDPSAPKTASALVVVAVQFPARSLEVGHILSAAATRTSDAGQAIPIASVEWSSSDTGILIVSSAGQVRARKIGTASIYATSGGAAGFGALTVTDSVPARVLVAAPRSNISVGAHMQLSAAVITATGRALPSHAISWSSTDFRYATVSASGVVTGVGTGTAHIVALASGVGDTSAIVVSVASTITPDPTNGTGGITHEPSTMKLIHEWDGHNQGAWLTSDGAPIRQTFAFDPDLKDTVMVQTYGPWAVPKGKTWGPGHLYFPIPAASRPVISFYLRTQVKLSSNWKQPPDMGDQKLFQWFPNGGHGYNVGAILQGDTRHPIFTAYELNDNDPGYNGVPLGQNPVGSEYVIPPPDFFTLNSWHTLELLVIGGTPGVKNGKVIAWLDGRMQVHRTDMMWVSAGQDRTFSQFDINSLWGGQGGTLSVAQYMYVGKIHFSGSSEIISDPIP